MIHETFHRFPGVEQSHAVVVKDIPVLIPRILFVPGLKCEWSVNEIEIQILEPESVQTRLESRFDALHAPGMASIVGRQHELSLLLDRWEKARGGAGQRAHQPRTHLRRIMGFWIGQDFERDGQQRVAGQHGHHAPRPWAIAGWMGLTCVMAARERHRAKRTGRASRRLSWPVLVLTGGVLLSLAANLDQAQPTTWGRITPATPAAAAIATTVRRPARISPQASAMNSA